MDTGLAAVLQQEAKGRSVDLLPQVWPSIQFPRHASTLSSNVYWDQRVVTPLALLTVYSADALLSCYRAKLLDYR